MKPSKKAFTAILLALLLSLICSEIIVAQKNDFTITETEKNEVINKALALLKDNYVFPDKIPSLEKIIRQKQASGYYLKLTTVAQFLEYLNTDLEKLTNDRHVNIFFDPLRVKQILAEKKGSYAKPKNNAEFLKRAKYENYMVRKAERLEGNVGYLKLDNFLDIRLSRATLVAAMNFLSNSDALIIDLRQNGGGHANTVNFLVNYFLPDSTFISEYTSRLTKITTKVYTQHDEEVQKIPNDVPLYVLVSKRTSSAAEAFAYTLQSFKRATIVGDTTHGEANPGYAFAVNNDMWMMIPTSVNLDAIRKTNWQGVGVIPDERINRENALNAAQAAAYKRLSTKSTDETLKNMYDWLTAEFTAKAYPVTPDQKELQLFVGEYNDNRKISVYQQHLFYERTGFVEKKKLLPLTESMFELEGASYFRVKFLKNSLGEIVALEGIYDDGKTEVSKKK